MKLVFILLFLSSLVYAKNDFYYGFINSSGIQISQKRINEIKEGFEIIKYARELSRNGRVDEAYSQIKAFKKENKIEILNSDIIILFAELSLKKMSKRFITEASNELEEAINNSKIHENDLARAYMILVELKLNINKSKDAKYFANIIINNFDNNVTKAYGRIFLAKVYKHQRNYVRATNILYEILTKTKDVLVATLVADELFDVYILDKKREKAYDLIRKVLNKNIDYYARDSFLALKKVNRLIKADMPEFAVEILLELLKRSKSPSSIEDFKFKLADTYMLMYDKTDKYLLKAKELYKDIINDYSQGIYFKKSKMYLDEILMRQRKIKPSVLSIKYKNSESMKQKVLLQELLNLKDNKNYEFILKSKKIYNQISNSIAKRFGYKSVNVIFDEVHIDIIKQYLNQGKCFLLNKTLKTSRNETLELLIEDEDIKYKFFECLIEVPYEKAYLLVKDTFNKSRDPIIYLYLERMAYALKKYDEALNFSYKVAMVGNKEVLNSEFLYKFLILTEINDPISLDKYFTFALNNNQYIEENESNPMIIDFYYQYYLFLIKKEYLKESKIILNKLYKKQNEISAHIYSPFVELELSKIAKTNNDMKRALKLILDALEYSRKIKANELVKVYYELSIIYDSFDNKIKKDEFISKCKNVQNTKNSLYKKMCEDM